MSAAAAKPWRALRVLPPPAAPKMRRCSIPGCQRQHMGYGWCRNHYQRWARTGNPGSTPAVRTASCQIPGCDRELCARGLCAAHYLRDWKGQDLTRPLYGLAPLERCAVTGCPRDRGALGVCRGHYGQFRRGRPVPGPLPPLPPCVIPGCDRDHCSNGFCQYHYERWYRKGDPVAPIERGAGNPRASASIEGAAS